MQLRASIVVIGDEILGGYVHDTNSHDLAQALQAAGVPLDRIVTVADDESAIVEALGAELARPRPRVVFTSGGIGSTPDDLTMKGVAAALDLPLAVQPDIDGRITQALEWTARQGVVVSEEHERAMRRMGMIPDGAYLLPGAQGVVPGIALDVDGGIDGAGATVVILPGIPSELRLILASAVPGLLDGRGTPSHRVELTHGYPESTLNPTLERLVATYPAVRVGSYPGPQCLIRLVGPHDDVEAAASDVRDALVALDADPSGARLRAAWASRMR